VLIGSILGNRYEIIERIGGGGMAVVYRAKDRYLNRPVAVKVLRRQFNEDDDFVQRFEREAQAAASLSHANVVNIFDVGQEGDVQYIVMEYVAGETLKDYITRRGPLPVEEALEYAYEICLGLIDAHHRGIIHRDIKPHNILLTPQGQVKVTDFGISRAVSSSETLAHTGTVMGSAHYFSPEQARGGFTDEKSDIYSVGIVLYEMLTGRVPFEGDSPIGVALRHVSDEVPPPRDLNPDIPECLEKVILTALAKRKEQRYPSVKHLASDLTRVAEGRDVQLAGGEVDEGATKVMKRVVGNDQDNGGRTQLAQRRQRASKERERSVWLGPVIWLAVIMLVLGAVAWGVIQFSDWFHLKHIAMPKVVGMEKQEARETLSDLRLEVKEFEQNNADIPAGIVYKQDPEPRNTVKEQQVVMIWISKGPRLIEVPPVAGLSFFEAKLRLEQAGLAVAEDEVEHVFHKTYQEGYVIDQNPRTGKLEEGTEVFLTVSKGPEPSALELPDLTGMTITAARQRVRQLSLVVGNVSTETSELPLGTVVTTVPAPNGMVEPGSTLNLVVSRGGFLKEELFTHVFSAPTDGPAEQNIRIVLTDAIETRTVYEGTHSPGDPIRVTGTWVGTSAKLRTYINGVYKYERTLTPGD